MKFLKYTCLLWALFILPVFQTNAQDNFISDENVTERIETEMSWQMDIPADRIDVETNNGIVMLTGSVPNILAKEKATTLAGAVRGVRGVVNQIKVEPGAVSDADLRKRIEENLYKNPVADSYEVNISVTNGNVSLTGMVESWQEKELTKYAVMRVNGVRSVENNLELKPVADRSDAEIEAEIEAAIQNNVRLHLSPVDVEVENGNVKLKGSVGSLNDQRQAVNFAWTYGVKTVDVSALDIDPWLKKENYRDATAVIDDNSIKKAVKDAFLYDPRVMSTKPEVTVRNGVVILRGKVPTLEAKQAAAADARNIVGVTMVKNNLKVGTEAPLERDEAITQRIKSALVDNTNVDMMSINVRVIGGIAYLSGTVNTEFERASAEEATATVPGVVRIINEIDTIYRMNYTPHPYNALSSYYYPNSYIYSPDYNGYPMTDVQIVRNIEQEWWWDSEVGEDDISVEVSYGVATLSGTVDSWQEMDAVVENAFEGGAKSIINNIKINGAEAN